MTVIHERENRPLEDIVKDVNRHTLSTPLTVFFICWPIFGWIYLIYQAKMQSKNLSELSIAVKDYNEADSTYRLGVETLMRIKGKKGLEGLPKTEKTQAFGNKSTDLSSIDFSEVSDDEIDSYIKEVPKIRAAATTYADKIEIIDHAKLQFS